MAVVAVAIAGCSKDEETLEPSCRDGPDAVLAALRTAPREVKVGDASLSDCVRHATAAGDLTEVGSSYLEVVQKLADRRGDPRARTQLGYLIGAIERGRIEEQGTSAELVRRLVDEAQRTDTRSAEYRRGLRAGRTGG